MTQDTLLTGLRRDHVSLVARYGLRFSLRTGGGLMTLLVALIAGLSVGGVVVSPIEALMKSAPELGHSEGEAAGTVDRIARSHQVADVAKWVTGADETQIQYLLRDQPALMSAILLILLMIVPFFSCLGGFNQTSGDIGSRGLRYLLLRTERPNIFIGRFVGAAGYLAVALAIDVVVLAVYIGVRFNVYGFGELALWSVQGYFAILLISLPYVALCAWMSGVLDSAFGSLAICLLLTGFPIIFLKLLNSASQGSVPWIEKLLPWGWKYDLLASDPLTRGTAYLVLLGFTALFLGLGLRSFGRRDL